MLVGVDPSRFAGPGNERVSCSTVFCPQYSDAHLPQPVNRLVSRLVTSLLVLAGLAELAIASYPVPLTREQEDPAATARPAASAADETAASGGGLTLSVAELERALLARHGRSDRGASILQHLLESRLVEELAGEAQLVVTDGAIQARWNELDRTLVLSGESGGLASYLESSGVRPTIFRHYLGIALAQEELARRALGIPQGGQVTGEQQRLWIEEAVAARGVSQEPWPFAEGVVSRCGDLALTRDQFTAHLREQLSPDELLTVCHQALLLKRERARMPDLSEAAVAAAITSEIERRRRESNADPKNQGVPYESLLAARGLDLEALRMDPAIPVAALAHLWVDRTHGTDGLRAVYQAERELFDGHFGTAVETSIILLKCSVLPNEFIPRTLEAGHEEAAALRDRILAGEDFALLARNHSEDRASREANGKLGWVTRSGPRVPEELRRALFDFVDRVDASTWAELTAAKRILGPVPVPSGVVLIWPGERRPPAPWTEMAAHVHRELRRRFLEECLKKEQVHLSAGGAQR